MKPIVAVSLVLIIALVGKELVAAQSPQQYYGGPGGEITEYVTGLDNAHLIGLYNVTANVPGFRANIARVNVTLNSSNTVNFQLQRSDVPVPEFHPDTVFLVTALILAMMLIIRKHSSKSSCSPATLF